MIEKAFLPVRLLNPQVEQFLTNHVAQRLHPIRQGNSIDGKGAKKMHMIGHDDVTTNCDVMPLSPQTKNAKCLMHFGTREKVFTFVCVERDEVERPDVIKQTTESGRSPWMLLPVIAGHT